MILVRDNIDQIVATCFSQEDAVILEFTQNNNKITIKDQFLYHYETACYKGTIEQLNKAIMYKIFQHQDLLLKIKDYKENITKILDLNEYNKVTLGYKDQLGSESTIGVTGSQTFSTNLQIDKYSGYDETENLNIDDQRTATSQTNAVEGLQTVIPQPSITEPQESIGRIQSRELKDFEEYILAGREIHSTTRYRKKKTLNNPQMEEGENPIGYQNLTKDITTNQTSNVNTTLSYRGSENEGANKTISSYGNTKGSKLDEVNRSVEYRTNEARLKVWKTELPKLQLKFWNIFYNLFEYEQY